MNQDLGGLAALTQAIVNMTIVMEGINSQLYLLREEMVRNRMNQEDIIDNDVTFKTLVADEISHILHGECDVR
ncbi:hypothetical protein [Methanoplanus limicola]|uniref:Uncharacterized protein n=1 Tax=Methanoplanus limicola DSM 2279 TaxID=937775 RepID=H1Z1A0_9EURY|nr:hypothetical protein [Methanoplanus limicola]EHQ35367.1 hypothetical protein Metlim_1258 [Methanoplanus limicola DSM 2279]